MCWRTEHGQATVEAAFLIPILFVVLLMLIQPGIILYDRMVMNHAASEGCRLLATADDSYGMTQERCEELIRRRLGAIPQHDLFHMHGGSCSYEIDVSGSGQTSRASVAISNKLRLLPLFDFTASMVGFANDGCITLKVERDMQTQSDWVLSGSAGLDPNAWVHARD